MATENSSNNKQAPAFPLSTILLVDDSEENRMVIEAFLLGSGWRVEVAENGIEAVEKFKNGRFAMVLMDLQMPVMDGIEATQKIRAWETEHRHNQKTPIIALTAHAAGPEWDQCREAGCNHVLTKPIRKQNLLQTIDSWKSGGQV
ncbi:MAG: response regulator [Magnetococcales bacterium]|nr:response regulator [Magnetococcales bacterium]